MTTTARTAMGSAIRRLTGVGIEAARLEARLLLGEVLRIDAAELVAHPERPLTAGEGERYDELIGRRCRRQPMAQLLGRREFWGLTFRVTPATLIPRPDSETLVAAVLETVADRAAPLRLLDLGTGCGCLLLALLSELPRATGVGVDVSAEALGVAQDNAAGQGLAARASFRQGSWTAGLDTPFDIIVSNPPYVPSAEIVGLMPEVALFEPTLALDGGADGLAAYRKLAAEVPARLAVGGLLALEIGAGQERAVAALLGAAGLAPVAERRDLAGHVRCLRFRSRA